MLTAAIIVGNPKLGSRTRDAAERLAAALDAKPAVIEVVEFGAPMRPQCGRSAATMAKTRRGVTQVESCR
jgi:hypothetical protein